MCRRTEEVGPTVGLINKYTNENLVSNQYTLLGPHKMRVPYSDWCVLASVRACVRPVRKNGVKSISQYLGVIHSPNLHQMFILTWSTDATWLFVSLTHILHFSDHGLEGMVKFILRYLLVLHSRNLLQLFIFTWSTDAMWWFVFLTYILRLNDHGFKSSFEFIGVLRHLQRYFSYTRVVR